MSANPSEEELARFHRRFGVDCNNRAWTLIEQIDRSADDGEELLLCANASAYHWRQVGTEHHKALGDVLLAHAYGALGHGDLAGGYADRAKAYFTQRESEPWELGFAATGMAMAAHARGDAAAHAASYAEAIRINEQLAGEDRSIFEKTLRAVPKP